MIDLATAKQHLRVEGDSEDTLIALYLAAAKQAIEDRTGRILAPPRAVTQKFAGFPYGAAAKLELWRGPVSIDTADVAISYEDSDGVTTELGDFRLVDGEHDAWILPAYGASFPLADGATGSVRVTYTAGYANDAVPAPLDQAQLLLTAHYYLNREAVSGQSASEIPEGVAALIAPYRRIRLS